MYPVLAVLSTMQGGEAEYLMDVVQTPFLESLVRELRQHPVNSNRFFETFRDQPLTRSQLRLFVRQYHYFCKHFVKLLEGLLYHTPVEQVRIRIELVKTLHSELGQGRMEQAHITLLTGFARAVGLREEELDRTDPIPAVRAYLQVLRRLFLESDYLVALGAEMAVEITAASEFRYFCPGLAKYHHFRENDIQFFKLHLNEEECHGDWLMEAVQNTATTPEACGRVAIGARETADAWHEFWEGLYREIFTSVAPGSRSDPSPSPCAS